MNHNFTTLFFGSVRLGTASFFIRFERYPACVQGFGNIPLLNGVGRDDKMYLRVLSKRCAK